VDGFNNTILVHQQGAFSRGGYSIRSHFLYPKQFPATSLATRKSAEWPKTALEFFLSSCYEYACKVAQTLCDGLCQAWAASLFFENSNSPDGFLTTSPCEDLEYVCIGPPSPAGKGRDALNLEIHDRADQLPKCGCQPIFSRKDAKAQRKQRIVASSSFFLDYSNQPFNQRPCPTYNEKDGKHHGGTEFTEQKGKIRRASTDETNP